MVGLISLHRIDRKGVNRFLGPPQSSYMPGHALSLLSSEGQQELPGLDVKISSFRGQEISYSVRVLTRKLVRRRLTRFMCQHAERFVCSSAGVVRRSKLTPTDQDGRVERPKRQICKTNSTNPSNICILPFPTESQETHLSQEWCEGYVRGRVRPAPRR